MMFPKEIESKLGFDRIRFLIQDQCLTSEGERLTNIMTPLFDADQVQLRMNQNREMMEVVKSGKNLVESRLPDIAQAVKILSIEGSVLKIDQLHAIRMNSRLVLKIIEWLDKRKGDYPFLIAISSGITPESRIVALIDRILTPDGALKPNASPKLAEILKKIGKTEKEIEQSIQRLYTKYKSLMLLADTEITIKDGRPVLPVLSEHKRKVRGYVHDESGGGKILYIEPDELIEINNEHRELELERNREIERILRQVCKELNVYADIIAHHLTFVGRLDHLQAKAIFGIKIQAFNPKVLDEPAVQWHQARHPLLLISMGRESKSPVSQDVFLNVENRIMVISGPNGGGKSVTLKTLGLLQYMFQCGIPVSVASNSSAGIFKDIFLVMGDEQSLETNLSSYTSHLMAIKTILEKGRDQSLVLIDEMGTGTDPTFGGPMAEAFLSEINRKKCVGIITTHFSNLKKIASKTAGLFNASMGYDTLHLQPLYTLISGKPGSSYAFEAAEKAGIPKSVIEKARNYTDQRILKLDRLLAEAETERNRFYEDSARLKQKESLADKLIAEYTELKKIIQENKKGMMDMAREKALTIIENANRDVEKTIREIKEERAGKEKTQKARQRLESRKTELRKEIGLPVFQPNSTPVNQSPPKPLKVGDWVRLKGLQMLAEIAEIKGNEAWITNGSIKTKVKLDQIEAAAPEKERKKAVLKRGVDLLEKQKDYRSEIDVRGLRSEEALKYIEHWLDEGHVLGMNRLRIIHGKGDGILMRLIRDYLRTQSIVKNLASEHPDMGGEGVTLVEIN